MKGLFTNQNGHLKTGRVAVLVFSMIILFLGILIEYSKPLDKALVSVKHVLIAHDPLKPDIEKTKPQPPDEPDRMAVNATTDLQDESDPTSSESVDELPQEQQVSQKAREEMSKKKSEGETPAEKRSSPAAAAPASEISETPLATGSSSDRIKVEPVSASENTNNADVTVKNPEPTFSEIPVETLKDLTRDQSDTRQTKDKPVFPKLNLSKSDNSVKTISYPDIQIDISKKLSGLVMQHNNQPVKQTASLNAENINIKPRSKRDTTLSPGHKPVMAGENPASVNLSSEHYLKLLRGWQSEGDTPSKSLDDRIALRIENLRNAYDLFQMKPVAVTPKGIFIDLTDGTRISEEALKPYSSTVFLVDDVWSKWGDVLKSSGIRQSDRLEVRYYMYGFIKNAIYSRTHRAFEWCKSHGLIPKDLQPSQVDVLGRAYRIERMGGGKFGVFIPLALDTKSGRTIPIDPICFAENPDVSELMSRGII